MTDDVLTNDARVPGKGLRFAGYVPLLIFFSRGVFLAFGLTLTPREVPSPLIGKPVPEFSLPPVKGRTLGLSSADLKGEVSLVNVFASWCVACRAEHPLFMELKGKGIVPIHGLNYKDRPEDAEKWLDELGDPYTRGGTFVIRRLHCSGIGSRHHIWSVVKRQGRIAY